MRIARVKPVRVAGQRRSKVAEPFKRNFRAKVGEDRWISGLPGNGSRLLGGTRPQIARLPMLEEALIFRLRDLGATSFSEQRQTLEVARACFDRCKRAARRYCAALTEPGVPLVVRYLTWLHVGAYDAQTYKRLSAVRSMADKRLLD